MKIDPDGYLIAAGVWAVALTAWWVGHHRAMMPLMAAGAVIGIFGVFCIAFFRDPDRQGPDDLDAVVSSADGVVVDVSRGSWDGLDGEALRIAVFMNVFNVHVNRAPLEGRVIETVHRNGRKLSAYNKRAELENEHADTDLETSWGRMRIRQIAGLVARRVVTRVRPGDVLVRGDRIGLIRFGSRVDIFLPSCFEPQVATGMKVRAGETVMARPAKRT